MGADSRRRVKSGAGGGLLGSGPPWRRQQGEGRWPEGLTGLRPGRGHFLLSGREASGRSRDSAKVNGWGCTEGVVGEGTGARQGAGRELGKGRGPCSRATSFLDEEADRPQ